MVEKKKKSKKIKRNNRSKNITRINRSKKIKRNNRSKNIIRINRSKKIKRNNRSKNIIRINRSKKDIRFNYRKNYNNTGSLDMVGGTNVGESVLFSDPKFYARFPSFDDLELLDTDPIVQGTFDISSNSRKGDSISGAKQLYTSYQENGLKDLRKVFVAINKVSLGDAPKIRSYIQGMKGIILQNCFSYEYSYVRKHYCMRTACPPADRRSPEKGGFLTINEYLLTDFAYNRHTFVSGILGFLAAYRNEARAFTDEFGRDTWGTRAGTADFTGVFICKNSIGSLPFIVSPKEEASQVLRNYDGKVEGFSEATSNQWDQYRLLCSRIFKETVYEDPTALETYKQIYGSGAYMDRSKKGAFPIGHFKQLCGLLPSDKLIENLQKACPECPGMAATNLGSLMPNYPKMQDGSQGPRTNMDEVNVTGFGEIPLLYFPDRPLEYFSIDKYTEVLTNSVEFLDELDKFITLVISNDVVKQSLLTCCGGGSGDVLRAKDFFKTTIIEAMGNPQSTLKFLKLDFEELDDGRLRINTKIDKINAQTMNNEYYNTLFSYLSSTVGQELISGYNV